VPATRPWTDTGIALSAANSLSINASGTIKIKPEDPGTGPEGRSYCNSDPYLVAPGLPCASLIGRVGNGQPFYVGPYAAGGPNIAGAPGEFFLGVNDDRRYFADNSGAWTVTIDVSGGPASGSTPHCGSGMHWDGHQCQPDYNCITGPNGKCQYQPVTTTAARRLALTPSRPASQVLNALPL
jgi:hypothetical protein